MRKIFLKVFSLMVSIALVAYLVPGAAWVKDVAAAGGNDVSSQFDITNFVLKNGETPITEGGEVHADPPPLFSFAIGLAQGLDPTFEAGDYILIPVPGEVFEYADIEGTTVQADGEDYVTLNMLDTPDGKKIRVALSSDGISTFNLNVEASLKSGLTGDADGEKDISVTFGSTTVSFTLKGLTPETPPPTSTPASFSKAFESLTDREWIWKMDVKAGSDGLQGAVITDILNTSRQELTGVSVDGEMIGTGSSEPYYTYDSGTGEVKVHLADMTAGENQTVRLMTELTDAVWYSASASQTLSNSASLSATGGTLPTVTTADASKDITNEWMTKEGSVVNAPNGKKAIEWTLTINTDGKILDNATLTDVLPSGLSIPTADDITVTPGLAGMTKSVDLNIITIEFPQISTVYTVKYTTLVTDPAAYDSNANKAFENAATLTWGWGGNPGPGQTASLTIPKTVNVSTRVLEKSAGTYDAANRTILWTIVVNRNQVELKNPTLTDALPTGLKYVPNSFTVQKYGETAVSVSGMPDESSSSITYDFDGYKDGDGGISDSYTLTYKTEVLEPKIYAWNYSGQPYKNTAALTADAGLIGTQTVEATATVNSNVLKKTDATYDYSTRTLTWVITVNENETELTNAVVEDILPAGLTYLDSASTPTASGSFTPADRKLTFNLGTIDEKYTITVKARVPEEQAVFGQPDPKTYTNTVTLKTDDNGTELLSQSAGSPVVNKNPLVKKDLTGIDGTNWIEWSVAINGNAWTIHNPVLTDTLQDGLILDEGSVSIYPQTLEADGSLTTDAAPIGKNLYTVTLNAATNTLTLQFKNTIHSPYLIQFITDIDLAKINGNTEISNTMQFAGGGVSSGLESQVNPLKLAAWSSNASATSKYGSLKIIKVDASNPSKLLPNAEYELWNQAKTIKKGTLVTDENGEALLPKLAYRVYYLKEVKAPENYNLQPDWMEIVISGAEPNVTKTLKNVKIGSAPVTDNTGTSSTPGTTPQEQSSAATATTTETSAPVVSSGGSSSEGVSAAETTTPDDRTLSVRTSKGQPAKGSVPVPQGSVPAVSTPPGHGTVTLNPDGSWTYSPDDGFEGTDTFTVSIMDASGALNTYHIKVAVGAAGNVASPNTGNEAFPVAALIGLSVGMFVVASHINSKKKKTFRKF